MAAETRSGQSRSGEIFRSGIRNILLIALWFGLLIFPFAGVEASITLFIVLSSALFLARWIAPQMRRLIEKAGGFHGKAKEKITVFRSSRATAFLLAASVLFLPFLISSYHLDVMILAGIYTILALGLNIIVGFTGLLNLGFVAFYAIGAYIYGLLVVKFGFSFWQALPVSLVCTTASGFLLAMPALRLRGDYLAIVTLGFGEIVRLVLNNWDSFTGGPNGIAGIIQPVLFGVPLRGPGAFYYFVLLSVFLTYSAVSRVRESRVGRAWIAIREDEIGASSTGINITRYKLFSFAFGSFWAGLAGVLFAAKMQFISPESFTFMESVLILCMVILGGLGSIGGVVLGALLLIALPEVLREVQSYRMIVLGAGLILLMIFRPQGLFSGLRDAAGGK